jgi:hypothetical protein
LRVVPAVTRENKELIAPLSTETVTWGAWAALAVGAWSDVSEINVNEREIHVKVLDTYLQNFHHS